MQSFFLLHSPFVHLKPSLQSEFEVHVFFPPSFLQNPSEQTSFSEQSLSWEKNCKATYFGLKIKEIYLTTIRASFLFVGNALSTFAWKIGLAVTVFSEIYAKSYFSKAVVEISFRFPKKSYLPTLWWSCDTSAIFANHVFIVTLWIFVTCFPWDFTFPIDTNWTFWTTTGIHTASTSGTKTSCTWPTDANVLLCHVNIDRCRLHTRIPVLTFKIY